VCHEPQARSPRLALQSGPENAHLTRAAQLVGQKARPGSSPRAGLSVFFSA